MLVLFLVNTLLSLLVDAMTSWNKDEWFRKENARAFTISDHWTRTKGKGTGLDNDAGCLYVGNGGGGEGKFI
jgi:hypothetical protein